jgi:hypothetical protein
VALVLLESSSAQEPIKVAGPHERSIWGVAREAFITGWGATSEGGGGSDVLRQARIKMIADETCRLLYSGLFFPAVMICAGELAGGVDTCQGDSGGPLVAPIAGTGYRLIGSTSFGDGCARPMRPGVYARLAGEPIRSILQEAVMVLAGADVVAPSNRFSFTRLSRDPRRGTARLVVRIPAPGALQLLPSNRLRRAERIAARPGNVALPVRPRGSARRKLDRSGRATVRATVTYVPEGGAANTKTRQVRLLQRR